jgi:VCBS repeat-containing protein
MAGITTAMPTSFKSELMTGTHDFTNSTGGTMKLALIKHTPTGTYGAASVNYSDITGNSDEASGTGYSAGGLTLTNVTPTTSGTTAYTNFSGTIQWTTATIDADGMMIYNSSKSNKACGVYDFGGEQKSTAGTFTINMPAAAAGTAILRIA